MLRKIIQIDEERCNGCTLCAKACHEGAIVMVDGKAKLLRDDYCDGLGDCLPVCPTGAITFVEREALVYNEEEVKKNMEQKKVEKLPCGCPGTNVKTMERKVPHAFLEGEEPAVSCLSQWPVQIKLVPPNAPYFDGASLLVAADCTAFAYGKFHDEFIRNRITLIGCPKLDEGDYAQKLTEIISGNNVKSITVARMEVPCCGGIENAVISALKASGKMIPWRVVTISINGEIISD